MTEFRRLLESLADAGVEFIIVGGLAATVHGSSRLTQDIDVVYRRTEDNLRRIEAGLRPHQPRPRDLEAIAELEALQERGEG